MVFRLRVASGIVLAIGMAFNGSAQFSAGETLIPFANSVSMVPYDMDGDGDPDLIGVFPGGVIKWLENTDGAGTFSPHALLVDAGGEILHTAFMDLDGDLDGDMVWVSSADSTLNVAWNAGAMSYDPPTVIASLADVELGALRVADITGDQLPEIIVSIGSGTVSRLAWFPNTAGTFGPLFQLPPWIEGAAPTVMVVGAVDPAAGHDILVINADGLALAAMNMNGDGSSWQLDTLFQVFSYPFSRPQLIDVDDDGDLDLAEASGIVVQWAENRINEDPPFDAFDIHALESFITAGSGRFGHVGCGPGASVIFVPSNPQYPVRWRTYLPAIGGFTPSTQLQNIPRGSDLRLADLDADGKDEIVMNTIFGTMLYRSITVPPTAVVEMPVFGTYCKSGPAIQLPEAVPAGGQWAGPWVNNGLFYRANISGSYNVPLSYTVHEVQGCPVAALVTVQLIAAPVVEPALGPILCTGSGPYVMTSTPANTQWAGLSQGNMLDPASYSGGVISCAYEDISGSTCVAFVGPFQVWNTISTEIQPAGPFCFNDGVQHILPVNNLAGNNWSGDIMGFTQGFALFDPSQGAGVYQVVLQRNASHPQECGNSDTLLITVSDAIPAVSVSAIPPYCSSGASIPLIGALPDGGEWSGFGVENGILDPALAGPGDHTVTYTYRAPEGCANSAQAVVSLIASISVEWTVEDLRVCKTDAPIVFTASPLGGVWSSPLSATGVIVPASLSVGDHPVFYTWTDPNGCVVQSNEVIVELLPPTVVVIDAVETLCATGNAINVMGSPSGTWSGSVSGEGASILFDPASLGEGVWPVTLSATAANSCPGSAAMDITVEDCTGIASLTHTVSITLAPNPFGSRTSLLLEGNGKAQVDVFDATGRTIQQVVLGIQGRTTLPLDLGQEPNGTYTIRVATDNGVAYLRAVKAE